MKIIWFKKCKELENIIKAKRKSLIQSFKLDLFDYYCICKKFPKPDLEKIKMFGYFVTGKSESIGEFAVPAPLSPESINVH